jgi:NAD(P)-dependent dehydrogenase (short-subunit alcohol dehydrogenase family)
VREFAGKVAVVTGGASGIGLAMARRFGAEGMRVVLADIEEPALFGAVGELAGEGLAVVGVLTDVADHAAVQNLHDQTLSEFGAVHVVCNNAGVVGTSVIETSIEVWRWVLGVNLWGVINGCNVFLPTLVAQGEGHVVNTASMAGLRGYGALGVYATTKFGVVGLSESLHQELAGSPVGVSVVCPGFVRTNIAASGRNMPQELRERAGRSEGAGLSDVVEATGIPPAEVADAVLEAVRTDRLYVLNHPEMARAALEERRSMMFGD